MKLDEIVAWYQKRIGTYDKQQWEKTVEQKIIDGFTSYTLKNAKLKTEFIDVDLVRGSTFPKAKPKQSLLTVIRLAFLRYFLLPIYARWWVKQTSPNIFGILLFLYITQMINWAIYSFNIHRLDDNVPEKEHIVSISELVIPMALSLILSLIHSQIVATNSISGINSKRKRFSNSTGKPRERVRRRKKLVKMRSQELADFTIAKSVLPTRSTTVHSLNKSLNETSSGTYSCNSFSTFLADIEQDYTQCHKTLHAVDVGLHSSFKGESQSATDDKATNETGFSDCLASNRKRNVNWDSPIHNYAIEAQNPNAICSTSNTTSSDSNTAATTSENQTKKQNNVQIDDSVEEFCDDLIKKAEESTESSSIGVYKSKRNIGDDDGFESLNGKSSSGEEISPMPRQSLNKFDLVFSGNEMTKNQTRLRLNGSGQEIQAKSENDLKIDAEIANTFPIFKQKTSFSSELDYDKQLLSSTNEIFLKKKSNVSLHTSLKAKHRLKESSDTDEDRDEGDVVSTPAAMTTSNYVECTTSATEWLGITTNSEECSYSSELENSDCYNRHQQMADDDDGYDIDFTPTTILNPNGSSDRVSCTIWDQRDVKKAQLSVLDISSCIIERVEAMPETSDYIYIGIFISIILSLIPCFCRLCEVTLDFEKDTEINYFDVPLLVWEKASFSLTTILLFAFGNTQWERTVLVIGFIQRLCLTLILFIIFAVAERTFKQRFLYAKLFSHLTSSRRAQKSNLPHFRLNKVRNIKTWLSVRSYLKKRGPQRSVDVIVSAAFMVTLFLLSFLIVEWLKDSVHLYSRFNLEALLWSIAIVTFLLRFMTLGNKINRKYRSISVLITEQINLYLQIEQKPKKKDELMVSNSVLKLAGDLLKELESPFKISGFSANPYLYTTIKVVILSALSGVLSEILGFKLKLHKIKIK